MSQIKLDLKQFKHLKSDAHSTTLQHKDGHTITIAHKPLGQEAKAQLSALGQSAKSAQTAANTDELKHKGMFADGGEAMFADQLQPKPAPQLPKKQPAPNKPPMSRQNDQASRVDMGHGKVIRKMAEGGEAHQCEGSKYCQECGEPMAKMAWGGGPEAPTDMTFAPRPEDSKPADAEQPSSQSGSPSLWEDIKGIPDKLLNYSEAPAFYGKAANMANKVTGGLFSPIASEAPAVQPTPGMISPANSAPPPSALAGYQSAEPSQQPEAQSPPEASEPPPQEAKQPAAPKPQAPPQAAAAPAAQPSAAVPEGQPLTQDQAFEVHKAKATDEHMAENDAWAQDLHNQHITPKTYASLFHDASIPGKISTIFSLMLGGMGGALTGTPSAGLAMMDKVIKNDLDAQMKSKDNAQNFLKLTQQHEMQKAQIGQMGVQNKLIGAQAANTSAEAATRNYALANMKANSVALNEMVQKRNSYPQGSPEWIKANNLLAYIAPTIQGENYKLASKAAAVDAVMSAGQQGTQDPEEAFQAKQRMLRYTGQGAMADQNEQRHIPGVGTATLPVPEHVRQKIISTKATQDLYNQALQLSQQYGGMNGLAQALTHPTERAKINAMAETLQHSLVNSIKQQQQDGALTEGKASFLAKQIGNSPTSIFSAITSDPHIKQLMMDDQQSYDRLLQGYGVKSQQLSPQQHSQQPQGSAGGGLPPAPAGKEWRMWQGKPFLYQIK